MRWVPTRVPLLYSDLTVESPEAEEGAQELAKATPEGVEGREEEVSLVGALGSYGKKINPYTVHGVVL